MRILALTPELPAPTAGGGATRQFHLLRRLRSIGHEVACVGPVRDGDEADELKAAGIAVFTGRRPGSRPAEALGRLRRRPGLAAVAVTRPVLAWQAEIMLGAVADPLADAVQQVSPDVALIEHDHAAAWARALPAQLPKLLTLHNVGWQYYKARARAMRPPRRWLFALESRRFQRHDLRAFSAYRRLIAVSEPDRGALEAAGVRVPIDVIPNGVDAGALRPLPDDSSSPAVIFTGTLNHPPNEEGVRWFAGEVWPRVRAQTPDATLLIVGRDPPPSVGRLNGHAGIEVVGPVADMTPWFRRSRVAVAPLLSGGGTRLKVLEALARGRAVVSTPIGSEGLELRDGRELLLASDPEPFASAVSRLLQDRAERQALAAAGRAAVAARYDWGQLGDALARALSSAASRGSAA